MSPLVIVAVLLGLVAAATALGLLWRARTGRAKAASGNVVLRAEEFGGSFGSSATLLQFSTEVCAPCAATKRLLGDIVSGEPTIEHVDVDVTHRPEIASRFKILQTPTTLILDGTGAVRARIGGAPSRATVRAELDRILAA